MKFIGSTSTESFIPLKNLYFGIILAKEFCIFIDFDPLNISKKYINNAIKHSPKNSSVIIDCEKIDKDFSDSHGQFLSKEGLIGLSDEDNISHVNTLLHEVLHAIIYQDTAYIIKLTFKISCLLPCTHDV